MANAQTRTSRIEARITPDTLALLRRAAEIKGRSLSEFVTAAAHDAALKAVEEMDVIRLTLAGQRAFADALINPPAPSEGLRKAFEAHKRLIREMR